jgi:hypothetical protein
MWMPSSWFELSSIEMEIAQSLFERFSRFINHLDGLNGSLLDYNGSYFTLHFLYADSSISSVDGRSDPGTGNHIFHDGAQNAAKR